MIEKRFFVNMIFISEDWCKVDLRKFYVDGSIILRLRPERRCKDGVG